MCIDRSCVCARLRRPSVLSVNGADACRCPSCDELFQLCVCVEFVARERRGITFNPPTWSTAQLCWRLSFLAEICCLPPAAQQGGALSDATDVTTRRGWAAVFCSVGRGTEVRSGTITDEYNGIGWGKSKGESGRDTNGARDRRNRPGRPRVS